MHDNGGASRAARVRAVHAETAPFDNPEQLLRALHQKLIPPLPLRVLQTPLHSILHLPRHRSIRRRLNKKPRASNVCASQLWISRHMHLMLNDANDAALRRVLFLRPCLSFSLLPPELNSLLLACSRTTLHDAARNTCMLHCIVTVR